jgi:hypothetical protein
MKFLTGTLLCSTILLLTGCSSSSTTPAATTATTTALTSIDGIWQSACQAIEIDGGPYSFQLTLTADDGNSVFIQDFYNGLTCEGDNLDEDGPENETYTLGDVVTVDGSVASITSATKIDLTDEDGVTSYNIIAISGNNLYVGDEGDDENNGIGETEENRPEQLANFALVKQ